MIALMSVTPATDLLYPPLQAYLEALRAEFDQIPPARQAQLGQLATYLRQKMAQAAPIALQFICTHNSRRSHLGQIWASTVAAYLGLPPLQTYSGGTAVTALNPRVVTALEQVGFQCDRPAGENPHYAVAFGATLPPVLCWSKLYDDPHNPTRGFAAIMTCSEADANCPFIPGAEWRLALPYADPKDADGTPEEAATYAERVRQIGREIFYALHLAAAPQ